MNGMPEETIEEKIYISYDSTNKNCQAGDFALVEYSFVIMVKGMSELVDSLMMKHKGSFESKRACDMDGFGVYGKTVKRKLYETDELIKAISTSKRSYEDILAYIPSAK